MSLRFFVSLLVLLGVASAASAAERRYTVTDFTRVRVDGGYGVKVTTGVSPFATASGTPAALDAVYGRTVRPGAAFQGSVRDRSRSTSERTTSPPPG